MQSFNRAIPQDAIAMIFTPNHRILLRGIGSFLLFHGAAAASLAAGPWTLDSPSSRLHVKID
jgi:hypothetical protein